MNNPELEMYNAFTEADLSFPIDSDPCLFREVQLPGMFLRVTELSGAENTRSYLDNDSMTAWGGYSQLLPSVDADPSSLPADAEASWYCQGEVVSRCSAFTVVVQVRSCAGLVVEGYYYEDNDTNEQAAREHLSDAVTETLQWAEDHYSCMPVTYPLHVFVLPQ